MIVSKLTWCQILCCLPHSYAGISLALKCQKANVATQDLVSLVVQAVGGAIAAGGQRIGSLEQAERVCLIACSSADLLLTEGAREAL